eukprot:TRINITY_DN107971_c0_g1_i1.p1 TRINITY_DN107971_c0_g1~~TRINITY_DN107971_c0_g1_i1.p1  ORF type:complete len:341 (-),score=72.17 TRINITY_DN107971_c0_g1_i1:80-1102(-)
MFNLIELCSQKLGTARPLSDCTVPSRLAAAEPFIRSLFADLESQCLEEQAKFSRTDQVPSKQKSNFWAAHIGPDNIAAYVTQSLSFLQSYPDFRACRLTQEHLRFAVMVQHFVSKDTWDFGRPESERQHDDTFEGFVSKSGVNSQLIKDAHRAEWSIDGVSFVMPEKQRMTNDERKQDIARFQQELVTTLEKFVLEFCERRCLSEEGTLSLLRAVTTQMSQCGVANLDRCSKAGKYMVGGKGLEQRVSYNVSCTEAGSLGEGLKLSLLCMKTGFQHFQTAGSGSDQDDFAPKSCAPSSYLYQYATLRFTTVPGVETVDGQDRINCDVIDTLDEVHLVEEH